VPVLGVVLIVLAMVLVFPLGIMLAGAGWSAAMGWLLAADADDRAEADSQ